MQVTVERPNVCTVVLKIEVEPERVTKAIDDTYREYNKATNIPGFRKGKTPRAILEKYVPEAKVKEFAAEDLLPAAYQEAVDQEKIDAYADPDVKIDQFEIGKPLLFTATVPLAPQIELGEYKGLKAKREVAPVTDEDVDAQIKYILESHATSSKVEGRGVQTGDMIVGEIVSTLEGENKAPAKRTLITVGENVPGFDEQIIGMEPGQSRIFSVDYADDYSDEKLAGKSVNFDVKVESIRERNIPELDEEFVKKMGDFETVDAFREDLKNRMIAGAEESADEKVRKEIIDQIVSKSNVCFPDALLEHELEHELDDLKSEMVKRRVTPAQYMKSMGKTEEEFIADVRARVTHDLTRGLVLGKIVDVENLNVTDEDVEAEIDDLAEKSNASRESVETFLDTRGGKAQLKSTMIDRKLADYLRSVSKIT
jgi:trigger factor